MLHTSPNTSPVYIYAPTLHRELAPEIIPPSVLFFSPGLTSAVSQQTFVPSNLPLAPAEAGSVLAELLRLGETLDVSAKHSAVFSTSTLRPAEFTPEEKKALRTFAATGKSGSLPREHAKNPTIDAHKVLLLAWDLEERLKELAVLREQVQLAAKPLEESLRDPSLFLTETFGISTSEDAKQACDTPYVSSHDALHALLELPDMVIDEPDWRITLTAMAAFLPQNTVIVTAQPSMCTVMRDAGMLHPMPEDVAEDLVLWPERLKSVCLWANGIPLWRLLGHTRPQELAPWLNMTLEILACPPDKITGL